MPHGSRAKKGTFRLQWLMPCFRSFLREEYMIQFDNVTKVYEKGAQPAIDNVSLHIDRRRQRIGQNNTDLADAEGTESDKGHHHDQ